MRRTTDLRRLVTRQEGGALVLVLIVLVLLSVLAVEIAFTARTHFRLADHDMDDFLLRTAVESRREILKAALRYDKSLGDNVDGEDDEWSFFNSDTLSRWSDSTPLQLDKGDGDEVETLAFKNTEVEIECWCEDERSKINLLGLSRPADSEVHKHTREALRRLIDLYRENWSDLDLSQGDADEMIDALVEWMNVRADEDENPEPATKANLGRLQSVDDLLRVPGGFWTQERLFDVADPEWLNEDDNDRRRRRKDAAEENEDVTADTRYERNNGIPGLVRYLSVWAQRAEEPSLKVNVNTASAVVLRALFEPVDEDLVDDIIEARRSNVRDPDESTDTDPVDSEGGFFKTKDDLKQRVDRIDEVDDFPRFNFFVAFQSEVYSLVVIAKKVAVQGEQGDSEEESFKDVLAVLHYREVVERVDQAPAQGGNSGRGGGGQGGQDAKTIRTLHVEQRRDPYFNR